MKAVVLKALRTCGTSAEVTESAISSKTKIFNREIINLEIRDISIKLNASYNIATVQVMARPAGFEPATLGSEDRSSIH